MTWLSRRRLRQKRIEFARSLKIEEIVATAHVNVSDPDLWHGVTAAGLRPQICSQIAPARQIDFLEIRAFASQQVFGHVAVTTIASRIDRHLMHRVGASPHALSLPESNLRRSRGDATLILRFAPLCRAFATF
jgi:hypothetical protein